METEAREVVRWRHRTLVRLLAPADEAAGIVDDLREEAAHIAAASGAREARRWLRWQIAHSAAPWLGRRIRETAARTSRSALMIPRGLASDLRLAVRRLVHARGFTSLAIVTLAIGIGAVSAVFSLAYGLWLKPVPYLDPDGLLYISAQHQPSGSPASLTATELAAFRRESQSLAAVAGYRYGASIARLDGEPVRVVSHAVTPNLFRVLGVRPAVGRDFVDADSGVPVVMLSHKTWTRRFNRDPAVVGKTMTMSGTAYEIAGVMPAGFTFPRAFEADVWIPESFVPSGGPERRVLLAVARLAPGRTPADASAETASRTRALAAAFPATNASWTAVVIPAGVTASQTSRLAFQVLLGIVALFLLIACTNLAGLLLARNVARRTELAVCLSLGATRWRLARMLLVESVLVAAAGGAAGVLLAAYATGALSMLMPPRMPGLDDVDVNGIVVALAIAVSIVSALMMALLPALSLRSMRPSDALSGSRTVARTVARGQRVLVMAEIALSVVLVVGASVMLRAFVGLLERDRGFDPNGLVALNVSLPFSDDSYLPTETRARVFDDIIARVLTVPGVRTAGATTGFPGSALGILGNAPVTPPGGGPQLVAALHAASPGYFETMAIPIKAGRGFASTDTTNAPGVAIVNESLARQFPGSPIGFQFPVSIQGEDRSVEIVGVAGDIHLTGRAGPRVFVPLAQHSPYWVDLVARGDGRASVLSAVRQTLRAMNPELLLENESSFREIISDSLALQRAQSGLAVMIGALSAIVAGVGLYALMAFALAQRRRELGIRLALGSQPAQLFRRAMSDALRLAAIGIVLGVIASAGLVRALGTQVFGLTSANGSAYATAAAIVLVVALVSAWIPARRVMRTDPLVSLRAD